MKWGEIEMETRNGNFCVLETYDFKTYHVWYHFNVILV